MNKTVILAAGDFPKKGGAAWRLLESARRVVACDGAANAYRRRFGRWPDFIVGDLDSCRVPKSAADRLVHVAEQDDNDLSKAIAFCRARGWRDLVAVGVTGRREDHTIGNVFRGLEAEVPIVSDFGVFHPVRGKVVLRTSPGTGVSVFAGDVRAKMRSKGLVWPLDDVRFANPYVATLNRADGCRVEVTSNVPAYVYVEDKA